MYMAMSRCVVSTQAWVLPSLFIPSHELVCIFIVLVTTEYGWKEAHPDDRAGY